MNEFEQHERVQPEKLPQGMTEERAATLIEIADKLKGLGRSSVVSPRARVAPDRGCASGRVSTA